MSGFARCKAQVNQVRSKTGHLMKNRRGFLKLATAAGAGAYLTSKSGLWSSVFAEVPGGTLPPGVIPKFVTPLVIPPAMPPSASDATTDYYTIAVRQFTQQILPARLPRTTVWSYGSLTDDRSFFLPALPPPGSALLPYPAIFRARPARMHTP